jgi:hypothetical protein
MEVYPALLTGGFYVLSERNLSRLAAALPCKAPGWSKGTSHCEQEVVHEEKIAFGPLA